MGAERAIARRAADSFDLLELLGRGTTVGIDATTLEVNAALRSIVRRDTAGSYDDFSTKLAQASEVEPPRVGTPRGLQGRFTVSYRQPLG